MAADAPAKCPQCGKTFAANVRICPDDGTVLEHDTQASQLGKVLDGKYRLESFLSRGGMGAVYKATHVMLGKTVAVKLINPELVTSPDVVRRFQREARSATALSHPNIASVFDLGQTAEGTLYIAMEFVDGRSLKSAIASGGPIQPARAVAIMKQVANALAVAHRNKIIHRDLKPQNIMLARGDDGQEVAKLVDFGIAKTFDEATQLTLAGDAIGTPHYMAPEQAAGKPVDARSDIYSAGIILYEMLSGEVPFNDTSAPAILIKHLQEAPQAPSTKNMKAAVPPALDAIALKCLEKDPNLRYQTAEELAAALDEAAATLPASTIQNQATMPMAAAGAPAMAGVATVPMAAAAPVPPPAPAVATARMGSASTAPAPPARPADTRPTVAAAAASAHPAADSPLPVPARSSKKPLAIVAALFVIAVVAAAVMQMRQGTEGPSAVTQQAAAAPAAPAATPAEASPPAASPAMAASGPSGGSASPPPASSQASAPQSPSAAVPAATPVPAGVAAPSASKSPAPPALAGRSSTAAGGATTTAGSARTANTPPSSATGAEPARQAQAPASPAASQSAASQPGASSAFPANPSVAFQCAGAPEICSPLRAAMDEALEKAGLPSVRNASRADISVTASANVTGGQANRQFGTNFTVMNYAIETSAEATKSSEAVSMPPSRQVSFDQQFGAQRATETSRVLASDIVDRIKAYAARKK